MNEWASTFTRLDAEKLDVCLKRYTLGEAWRKPTGGLRPRLLSGRPSGPMNTFGVYMHLYTYSKDRKKFVMRRPE